MAYQKVIKSITTRQAAKISGEKRYIGRPCPYGHSGERYTFSGACTECLRLKAPGVLKRWLAKQPPELTRARAASQRRAWRKRYPERAKKKDAENRAKADPEKRKQLIRSWESRNKEHRKAYALKRKQEDPESFRLMCQRRERRRKSRKQGATGTFTKANIERLLLDQAGRCTGCEKDISVKFEIDHIIPLARGGSNDPENLQLMCRSCNASKGALTMAEWLASGRPTLPR